MFTTLFYISLFLFFLYGIFLVVQIFHDRRHKKIMHKIAENLNLKCENTEIFSRMLISLDPRSNTLIYISNYSGIELRTINLDMVGSCKLIMKELSIQLELSYKEQFKASDTLVFFQKYLHPEHRRTMLHKRSKAWKTRIENRSNQLKESPLSKLKHARITQS